MYKCADNTTYLVMVPARKAREQLGIHDRDGSCAGIGLYPECPKCYGGLSAPSPVLPKHPGTTVGCE